ncbi:MAG: WHG domain-containing protein [Solobacterium sp.]|nr:WHG domain-containing protein [Solobacterium sp.]
MPPKVKFQKEEIVQAALNIVRKKSIRAVTAREVAAELNVSPRPIFTYYDSMDSLRRDVCEQAKEHYRKYIERGLQAEIPFQGVFRQYLQFAREEPELYRLLFLMPSGSGTQGAIEAMHFSQDLVRDSLMQNYRIDALTADSYFRSMWLSACGVASLIVSGSCPWSDEEILAIGSEISLALYKAYKEIPGFTEGTYDKDAVFRSLVNR